MLTVLEVLGSLCVSTLTFTFSLSPPLLYLTRSMFLLSLLITMEAVSSRLVLESWAEIYREDGSVDLDRLLAEADIVSVSTEPYQECPEVNVNVTEYEIFLMEEGVEVRDTLEKQEIYDIWNTTKTVRSMSEPWIKGDIMLRSGQIKIQSKIKVIRILHNNNIVH